MKFSKAFAAVLALLLVLSVTLGMLPTEAEAASSSEIRNQIAQMKQRQKEMEEEYEELQNQFTENENEILNLVNQKNLIDQEISLMTEQITNINQQIAAFNLLIADKQDELDEAQARFNELSEKNKERIRAMEEEGSLSYWAVLFEANSFADLLDRLNMIEEIAAADHRRMEELTEAAEAVAAAQEALETEKAEQETARDELAAAEAELESKRQELDEVLRQLIAKGEEFEKLLDESEALQDELMQEIAAAEAELKIAQYQEWLATYVPPTTLPSTETTPSTDTPSSSGWVRPLSYIQVTSPFGMRMHPILGYERMHNGVDLAATSGTPIYAAKSGMVTVASYQENGAGWYVSINHGDGYSSIYMHMTNYIVYAGQYVNAGQVIGYVGNSGLSKGAHLHFGISHNGRYVNPMDFI